MSLPLVAIIGRPNVGKSSLFNRLVGARLAVVDDRPGITRDRHVAVAEWNGRAFFLMDTGGFLPGGQGLESAVRRQAELAIQAANLVLLVVEAEVGATDLDRHLVKLLHRQDKQAILVVNKADRPEDPRVHDFHSLGLGVPHGVSAVQGLGTGDLLDDVVRRLPAGEAPADDSVRVAIVGRPNVGKSSLVNALLREERMVVHDQPGTTMDSVDSRFEAAGHAFTLVDTAGLRHRSQFEDDAEFYATLRSLRAIERAEVVTVVLDARESVTRQDQRVISSALDAGRPVLLAFNKWDLVETREERWKEIERELTRVQPWLAELPRLPLSATARTHLHDLPRQWLSLSETAARAVPTPELNEWLQEVQAERQAPSTRLGRPARLYYASQVGVRPPRFALFASQPEAINAAYHRFLVRRLRDRFALTGVPVRLEVRKSQ